MSDEQQTEDPQNFRGGANEPDTSKGGAPGGAVPREMVDEPVSGKSDEQEMGEEALGDMADVEPSVQVPRDGGDQADATTDGGHDEDDPSRVGSGSTPNTPGRVGDATGQ
jgi:hypothetical protein